MQMLPELTEFLISWIEKQQMFWVASAPLTADGFVNISPKGVEGTFHVANTRRVWYEDLSGSGAETISHIRENGRVTVLLHAFEGPPRIVRIYGKGSVHEFGTPEYTALLPEGTRHPGSRAVIALDIYKVATTCGYSVPFYEFKGHRTQLLEWAAKKEAADRDAEMGIGFSSATSTSPSDSTSIRSHVQLGMKKWWEERNTTSLDGLPGVMLAHASDAVFKSKPIAKRNTLEHRRVSMKVKEKMSKAFRWADAKTLTAFFVGILVCLAIQRMAGVFLLDYSYEFLLRL